MEVFSCLWWYKGSLLCLDQTAGDDSTHLIYYYFNPLLLNFTSDASEGRCARHLCNRRVEARRCRSNTRGRLSKSHHRRAGGAAWIILHPFLKSAVRLLSNFSIQLFFFRSFFAWHLFSPVSSFHSIFVFISFKSFSFCLLFIISHFSFSLTLIFSYSSVTRLERFTLCFQIVFLPMFCDCGNKDNPAEMFPLCHVSTAWYDNSTF